MKKLPNWTSVNEAFYGLREAVKGQQFVTLSWSHAQRTPPVLRTGPVMPSKRLRSSVIAAASLRNSG